MLTQLFRHETKQQLSLELVAFFERREKLACLTTEVIKRRPNNELAPLLGKLSPCSPFKKVQIILPVDLLENASGWLGEFAARLGVAVDDVVLIGAASGSMRLLVCLPQKIVEILVESGIHSLADKRLGIFSITAFDSLDNVNKTAWYYTVSTRPPERQENVLRPVVFWKESLAVAVRSRHELP